MAAKSKGVLLDANLLTALIVGYIGAGEVEQFKRTRQFTTKDVIELHRSLRALAGYALRLT